MKRAEKLLLFLTVFLIPTQLGKHFWPQFSQVYSLPIDYLSPTIYLWDILVLLLCTVFIIRKKHINRVALSFFYFFILLQSLSILVSKNPDVGFVRLEQYTFAGLFGVYIASHSLEKVKPALLFGLGGAIIFQSLLAVLQFLKAGTVGLWFLGERTFSISTPGIAKFDFRGFEFLRPYGTFPHPNCLSGFMVVALPLISFLKPLSKLTRWSLILGSITTLLTFSRTAILAAILEGVFLLNKKWRIILLGALLILSPVLLTRFEALFNYDNLTFVRREELFLNAWNLFLSSPIFGVGLNNFIPESSVGVISGPSRFLQPVHNIFLLSLSETGLVGFTSLLLTFGYSIWRVKKNKIFLIIWGIIIFLGLFDHYFLTLPQGYRLLFLIWGLSFSLKLKTNT